MNCFKVIHPGILSCFQDLGRYGWRKYGIPQSGPMDRMAFIAANLLIGNDENSTVLEITLHGLKLEALRSCQVAVTGADLGFSINGEYLPSWSCHRVRPGDLLSFKGRKSGLRCYLAITGGFVAPVFLNSTSVFQMGNMGQPLSQGQMLQGSFSYNRNHSTGPIPQSLIPRDRPPFKIRVIPGPQDQAFSRTGRDNFISSTFKVTPQSNRMALRLDGPALQHLGAADIISEPVTPGSIQVPQDGRPIVLMADAQTTGGYAKIATVISPDLDILGQAIPGDTVSFEPVNMAMAAKAREKHNKLLDWIRAHSN